MSWYEVLATVLVALVAGGGLLWLARCVADAQRRDWP